MTDLTPHTGMELGYARVSTTKRHLDRAPATRDTH